MNNDDQQNYKRPRLGNARLGRAVALVAALAVSGLLAAACGGGSSHAGSAPSPGENLAVGLDSFASCMRSHGVPGFHFTRQSDPTSLPANAAVVEVGFHGYYAQFDPDSPAFQAAQKTCEHLLPFSGGLTGTGTGGTHQQFLQALKVVACMRSHGYPDWPDPINNHVMFPANVDTHSAQFQASAKTCGLSVPSGL
ncbi:MAG: hypothetical protein WBH47_06815 [Streptosporangiaceae bacterium]